MILCKNIHLVLVSLLLLTLAHFQTAAQCGYYKSLSDIGKADQLIAMDSISKVKSNNIFFWKNGEEVKVNKDDYAAFVDNEGYLCRMLKGKKEPFRLHVKGKICAWVSSPSIYSYRVIYTKDYTYVYYPEAPKYASNNYSVAVSKGIKGDLEIAHNKTMRKLVRSDREMFDILKGIGKVRFNYDMALDYAVIYNARHPSKNDKLIP